MVGGGDFLRATATGLKPATLRSRASSLNHYTTPQPENLPRRSASLQPSLSFVPRTTRGSCCCTPQLLLLLSLLLLLMLLLLVDRARRCCSPLLLMLLLVLLLAATRCCCSLLAAAAPRCCAACCPASFRHACVVDRGARRVALVA